MSKNLDNVFGQYYYDNQYIGMKILRGTDLK